MFMNPFTAIIQAESIILNKKKKILLSVIIFITTAVINSNAIEPFMVLLNVPTAKSIDDDPLGLKLKKLILEQVFNELPRKGMPSVANPTDSTTVYVFLVGRKNVSTYITDLLPVQMYSDKTWPSSKDTRQRFAHSLGLPIERVTIAGFFNDSLAARKIWNNYNEKILAYGINRFSAAFSINPDLALTGTDNTPQPAILSLSELPKRETKIVNLPDITVTGKYRPSVGIMPIIDVENNLNQQFLVNQYLIDNPVILNGKDTLQPSLTDYRSYTQYALGGSMDKISYRLKLWQREKLLAEIYISINEKTPLEDRMTRIARQLGQILSGNTTHYKVQLNTSTLNLVDITETIQEEVQKNTKITTLFPDATMHYLPPNFSLPNQLKHLALRLDRKPYYSKSANIMAQLVRGIYSQADEKQFFFINENIPQEMKDAVRKITQPTSRRIGSALSYVAVGDAFLNNESNLDGAASAYYSALLLVHNLAASPLEKASVKQLVYARMKKIAQSRKQPNLASMFELAEDLNTSFLQSEFAQASHQEYYTLLNQNAKLFMDTELQAREVKAQARLSGLTQLAQMAGSFAQAPQGKLSFVDQLQLQQRLNSLAQPAQQAKAAFVESLADIAYEKLVIRDESGTEIELNKFYLNIEVMGHLALRRDQTTVAKRLLSYAADKSNLRLALEEYLAETEVSKQAIAIDEFHNLFKGIEAQVNSYESWGKKLPNKVLGRF